MSFSARWVSENAAHLKSFEPRQWVCVINIVYITR